MGLMFPKPGLPAPLLRFWVDVNPGRHHPTHRTAVSLETAQEPVKIQRVSSRGRSESSSVRGECTHPPGTRG